MTEKKYRIYLCGGPHCTAHGNALLLKTLEDTLWAQRLDDDVEIRVSGCQDRCDFAPNLTVWPGPFRYSQLTPAAIVRLVEQHLRDGQPVTELLSGDAMRRH